MTRTHATIACLLTAAAAAHPVPVEVVKTDRGHELQRGGEPYFIRGAGGQDHLDVLVSAGGNSIRTWGADNAKQILDAAHEKGLTVTLGIWLGHERHGFNYDDPKMVADQREMVRRTVEENKDHPALLMWGLGNEVALVGDPERLFPHIESLAAMVQELDPNHPVMTVVSGAGEDKIRTLVELCPSIDVLGVNEYGGARHVPHLLESAGYEGPYVLTEYGPRGWWESPTTDWGAQIEQTTVEKMETYRDAYEFAVSSQPGRAVGSYVFLWGQKQEATPTWFSMFMPDGTKTAVVDVMQDLWTGTKPEDHAPVVRRIRSSAALSTVRPGKTFAASVDVTDADNDQLTVLWEVIAESTDRKMGGDAEDAPPVVEGAVTRQAIKGAKITAPDQPGQYRLFVTVKDPAGNTGSANVPFLVQ